MVGGLDARSARRFEALWLLPLLTGLLLRLALLYGAVGIRLFRDEVHYLRHAVHWSLFGVYTSVRPPGYPWFLSTLIELFGSHGPMLAKLTQVFAAVTIGVGTMLLANRLYGRRAALVAGFVWALYVPLAGFTHMFWPETLFLVILVPTLVLFHSYLEDPDSPAGVVRLLGCGVLAGFALLLKDSAVVLPPLLLLGIAVERLRQRRSPLGRVVVLALAILAVVTPWTLRSYDLYNRLAPPGSTAGMNFFVGMNGTYRNFDYLSGEARQAYPRQHWVRRWFLEPQAESWERSRDPNLIDQSRENVRRGLAFMAARPGFFVRSRIKKLADLLNPTSFVVRHARIGLYRAPFDAPWIRWGVIWLSLASAATLLIAAWAGIALSPRRSPGWWLMVATCAAFAAPALLNAMSRGRAPMLPALIVLAAGWAARGRQALSASRGALALFAAGLVALGALWLLNLEGLAVTLGNFRE